MIKELKLIGTDFAIESKHMIHYWKPSVIGDYMSCTLYMQIREVMSAHSTEICESLTEWFHKMKRY